MSEEEKETARREAQAQAANPDEEIVEEGTAGDEGIENLVNVGRFGMIWDGFGMIWDGFGMVLGWFEMVLGWFWDGFGMDLGIETPAQQLSYNHHPIL